MSVFENLLPGFVSKINKDKLRAKQRKEVEDDMAADKAALRQVVVALVDELLQLPGTHLSDSDESTWSIDFQVNASDIQVIWFELENTPMSRHDFDGTSYPTTKPTLRIGYRANTYDDPIRSSLLTISDLANIRYFIEDRLNDSYSSGFSQAVEDALLTGKPSAPRTEDSQAVGRRIIRADEEEQAKAA